MGTKSLILSALGGVVAVAKACGVTHGAVSQWDEDDIPLRHIPALVKAGIDFSVFYPDSVHSRKSSVIKKS